MRGLHACENYLLAGDCKCGWIADGPVCDLKCQLCRVAGDRGSFPEAVQKLLREQRGLLIAGLKAGMKANKDLQLKMELQTLAGSREEIL